MELVLKINNLHEYEIKNKISDKVIIYLLKHTNLFTRIEFINVLHKIFTYSDTNISFKQKINCLSIINNYELAINFLEIFCSYDITTLIENKITFEHYFNFYYYILNKLNKGRFDYNQNIVETLTTKNTIARGDNVYQCVKMLCNTNPKIRPLVTFALNNYFYNNRGHVINYLALILQLYFNNNLLIPEICDIAIQLAGNDQMVLYDLADFFIHLPVIEQKFVRFKNWGDNMILLHNPHPQQGDEDDPNIMTNKHSVHLLDKIRTNLLMWLNKKCNLAEFDPKLLENSMLDKFDPDVVKNHKLHSKLKSKLNKLDGDEEKELSANRKMKIIGAIKRICDDNTDIIYTSEEALNIKWSLYDVYDRICFVVAIHEESVILYERLKEELESSYQTCFSGHFNRLFNVFTGFENNLTIIDIKKEFERVLKVHLGNIYNETSDENIQDQIMDLVSGGSLNNDLKKYLIDKIKNIKEILIDKFKTQMTIEEMDSKLVETVNKYFQKEIMQLQKSDEQIKIISYLSDCAKQIVELSNNIIDVEVLLNGISELYPVSEYNKLVLDIKNFNVNDNSVVNDALFWWLWNNFDSIKLCDYSINFYCKQLNTIELTNNLNYYPDRNKTVVYHGTKFKNLISIIKYGLKILSKTKFMINGNALGNGIYTSLNIKTAYDYSKGEKYKFVAVCDSYEHTSNVFNKNICVIKNQENIVVTHILIFNNVQ
jgi:hypothetical protein